MKQRILELLGVVAAIIVVSLVLVAAQAPTASKTTGPVLKTSWGEPDLQGLWSAEYQVPLQRPAKYKDKLFFTDAEMAALDKERAAKPAFGEKRGEKGTERDVAGAYDSAVFLTRRHTGRATSLIVDPPDGRIPPFTPQVEERRSYIRAFELALIEATATCKNKWRGCEGGKYTGIPSNRRDEPFKYYPVRFTTGGINRMDNPEDHGLSYRCMSGALPDFGGGTGNVRAFTQSPGVVTIFYDTGQGQGWHRVIPLDASPHLPPSIRLWWGDSRGHWEGNTLVVDVTNFSPRTEWQQSRENLHLIERFTRTGPNTLEYVVTMDDKTTWTKPWTVKQEYQKQGDQFNRVFKEPRCHEGNYGLTGALAGARQKDLAFSEGRGPDPRLTNYAESTNSALDDEDLDELQ
jgi:hypothetical protein